MSIRCHFLPCNLAKPLIQNKPPLSPLNIRMENFYEWLKWTPFYNNTQALKTIVYGDRIHPYRMGLNYGVLIAIVVTNCCTLSLATVFERWRMNKGREAGSGSGDGDALDRGVDGEEVQGEREGEEEVKQEQNGVPSSSGV